MATRNIHAGLPITDDDATNAAALEDVSIPTLLLPLVHIAGDPSYIQGEFRPQGSYLNEVQGFMSEEAKASVRKHALEVIREFRDGGCKLPPPPGPELIQEMMSFLVCAPVPDEYVPMEIVGRDGVVLSEHRGERPAAYLGITIPGFPNLFCMYGPGTNLAHGGSLIFHFECQMRYIGGCPKALIERGAGAMEPRQEVHDDYYERTQRELERYVWSQPSVKSTWYKNAEGKIHISSPWRLVDYWSWTREPDLKDYEIA